MANKEVLVKKTNTKETKKLNLKQQFACENADITMRCDTQYSTEQF